MTIEFIITQDNFEKIVRECEQYALRIEGMPDNFNVKSQWQKGYSKACGIMRMAMIGRLQLMINEEILKIKLEKKKKSK